MFNIIGLRLEDALNKLDGKEVLVIKNDIAEDAKLDSELVVAYQIIDGKVVLTTSRFKLDIDGD